MIKTIMMEMLEIEYRIIQLGCPPSFNAGLAMPPGQGTLQLLRK
ncbi:MAG: hypothetical protein ACLP9S_03280 [Syntrophales bacterium]